MSKKRIPYYLGLFSLYTHFLVGADAPGAPNQLGFYPNPGIIAPRGNRWVGTDHLYNLSNNIGINVEILKPDNLTIPFSAESLQQTASEIFKKAGIFPSKTQEGSQFPLPAFHFLIMIQKVDKGYAIFCSGRLFESITLDRIHLSEHTYMQAITWESQDFAIASTADIESETRKSVTEVAQSFVERHQFFRNIKAEIQKK